jgi:hypothetical protein
MRHRAYQAVEDSMKFHSDRAEIYVPDGQQPAKALRRTTHLAISAHHDDIEILRRMR